MAAKSEHPQNLNLASDDAPACATSVNVVLKSELGHKLDLLRESKQGVLPASSQYPRWTTGVMLIPGTDVQILHGRSDGRYRVQVGNRCDAVSMYEVELCRRQLFTDARDVRVDCMQIRFKVGEIGAGWNGRGGPASSSQQFQNGTRLRSQFRPNAVGLPWHAEWDNGAGLLRVRVMLNRPFLTRCGIATLRDVIGLRQVKLGTLLSPKDICQLPVPFSFSKSREALTERLEQMLRELCF